MAVNNTGILFLDRNGFLLFSDSINKVIQFNFPPTIVRDLEIINHDQLEAMIAAFFKQAELAPFQMVILLSDNLLFEKVFTTPQDEKGQKELEQFMDNLPFEHVGSIIYTDQGESKYIASNKDLYQGIAKAFEKLSCVLSGTVPAFVVGLDINQMAQITPQMASDVFRRAVSLRQYSFLVDKPKVVTPSSDAKQTEKPKTETPPGSDEYIPQGGEKKEGKSSNTRVFILVGVFVILLGILGVVAFTML